jgi:hypothetical protein
MKKKQLIILCSVLVLLVLLLVWQKRQSLFKLEPSDNKSGLLFVDFDPQQAAQIKLTTPDKETILTRQDEQWVVSGTNNILANAESVNQLLTRVTQLKKGDIISQQPAKFKLFQVDDAGLEVNITDHENNSLVNFYLGKQGPDFNSIYIRKEGSNEVLLLGENPRFIFDKPDWRKKELFKFDTQAVTGLCLEYDNQIFSLVKEEENWQLMQPENTPANPKTINLILDSLNRLRIIDYVEEQQPLATYGLDKPWFKIKLNLSNGINIGLIAGNKKEDDTLYYAKSDDNKFIFTLPIHQLDRLKKNLTDFKLQKKEKKQPPTPPAINKTKKTTDQTPTK